MTAPPRATLRASVIGAATGGLVGANAREVLDVVGAGPVAMCAAFAAPVLALALLPPLRARWAGLAVAGGIVLANFEILAGLVARGTDPRAALVVVDLLGVALLAAPLARPVPAGRWTGPVAGLLGLVAAFLLPRELALAGIVVGALLGASSAVAPPPPWRAASSFLGSAVALAGALAWSLARAPLDPTGRGWLLFAGAALGLAAARGRAAGFAGGLLAACVGAAWAQGPAWIDGHLARLAGPVVATLTGAATGLLVGAARPGRLLGVGLVAVGPVSGVLLPLLPASVVGPATRAVATFGANQVARARTEALRGGSTPALLALGPTGASALWVKGRGTFAELDGTVADPTSRAGDAERFTGTLGACLAPGRTRARVGGDDLVLATRALVPQGFLAIDVAVPDRPFARAQAAALPDLADVWLRPAVRAVPLPSAALLRIGAPADLIVEIDRAGWSDGRAVVPDARGFRALRRTLAPDGVYVLALGTTRLGDGEFARIVADLLDVFVDVGVWSPPVGVDTALLVARTEAGPVPWDRVTRCASADPGGLRALGLRTAEDVAGRYVAGRAALAAVAVHGAPPVGLPVVSDDPPLPLLDLDASLADPAALFDTSAPATALTERHASQAAFFALLRDGRGGSIQDAIQRARLLAPGSDQIVATLVRPHLERARQAMARAAREGVGSHGWQEAETAITNAELIAPGLAETRCVSAELAEHKNDIVQAAAAYRACVDADPGNLVGLNGVARIARVRGDLDTAETALRAARNAAPDRWLTAQNLGVLLKQRGKLDEAERLLRDAARLAAAETPTPAAPNLALAELYLASQRPGLALAEAERAKTLDGAGAAAPTLAGVARLELGQLDVAERELRAALAADPDYLPARGELGILQAERGQYPLAAESFKAVLERDPANAQARENLRRLQERGVVDGP